MSVAPSSGIHVLRRVPWGLMVAAVVSVGYGSSAEAYERTQTCDPYGAHKCEEGEEPKPISWPVRCLEYRINERGSSDFSGDGDITPGLRELVRTSFRAWQQPECSDLHLVEGDPTANDEAKYERSKGWTGNMNLVVWREEEWPYERGHSFALTSVTYNTNDGRIVDADIELNAADETFADFEESRQGETTKVDVRNALTHEVGHFIGLDHSAESAATMYQSALPGEIDKRELHRDDIRGLCAIYPSGEDPETCDSASDFLPPDARDGLPGRGCRCRIVQFGGDVSWPTPALLLLVPLFLLFRLSNS